MLKLFGFDLADTPPRGLGRALLLGFAGAACDVVPYVVLVSTFTALQAGTATVATVVTAAAVLTAAFLGGWFCKALGLFASFSTTYDIVAAMRLAAADRLGRMSLGAVLRQRGATLADLFTDRFSLYQDIATHMWWQVSSVIAFPVLLWLLLAVMDWRIAAVIAVAAPLSVAIVPWSFRLLDRATDEVIPARDSLANHYVELVEGIKDIRLSDPRASRAQATRDAVAAFETKSLATELAPAPAILAFGFVWALALAAAIVCAALLWTGDLAAPLTLVLSLLIAARLCASLSELGVFIVEYRFARRALQSIRDFFDQPLMPAPVAPRVPETYDVMFDKVHFAHEVKNAAKHEAETALADVSLSIPQGHMLALVGPSGSGKSTLAGLAARLWDVDGGAIRIGGVDLRDMDADVLNATISMVLQDVSLFDLSVRDNIRLGRPDATQAEVEAAARAAQIHTRILTLPQGYDTVLARNGGALSGGERQRIAIARALLKDAPILILDEASASIDLDCEWLIQQALDRAARDKTVIVIAHRLWTIKRADSIAVMNGGAVTELGTHVELLARNGIYAQLWRRSSAE